MTAEDNAKVATTVPAVGCVPKTSYTVSSGIPYDLGAARARNI